MITVTLLALAYVISVLLFMAWAKTHSPEGREEYELGFIYSPVAAKTAKQPIERAVASRPVMADRLGLVR